MAFGNILDDVFIPHKFVGLLDQRRVKHVYFGLPTGGDFMMVFLNHNSDLLHFLDHFGPDILLCIGRAYGEITALSHTDSCASGGEPAFRPGDVGSALKLLRGDEAGHGRRLDFEIVLGEGKTGRGLPEQHGKGVFQLRTLQGDVDGLGLCGLELSFRRGDVGTRIDALGITVLGDF